MNKVSKALTVAFLLTGILAQAQPGWNWGEQVDVAKEKNALYVDMYKAGKLKESIAPLTWLMENTPDLNESIYINGAKIYEGLVDKEKDPAKKSEYEEKALSMYDLRIKYYGNEANVMNRKVFPAYKYYKDDKAKYKELYDMFTKSFQLNGNDFYDANLVAFIDVVRRYKLTGGDISDEKVIDIYGQLTDVIDVKRAEGKKLDRLEKIADQVDKVLTATIDLNCDFVESILGPKFKQTGDVKIAKKIFQLMLNGKCTDRPLAFEAAKAVNVNEPSFGIAKFLGIKAAQDGKYDEAVSFYEQSISLTDENIKKAEIYMNMAGLDAARDKKVSARSNARKSLAFDPSNKEAFNLIANLYMQSFEECKAGSKKTEDYAIFIAAHKYYKLAGNSDGASKAKELFPSMEDMFNEDYQEGQSYQVGCWINETVTLERRPAN